MLCHMNFYNLINENDFLDVWYDHGLHPDVWYGFLYLRLHTIKGINKTHLIQTVIVHIQKCDMLMSFV